MVNRKPMAYWLLQSIACFSLPALSCTSVVFTVHLRVVWFIIGNPFVSLCCGSPDLIMLYEYAALVVNTQMLTPERPVALPDQLLPISFMCVFMQMPHGLGHNVSGGCGYSLGSLFAHQHLLLHQGVRCRLVKGKKWQHCWPSKKEQSCAAQPASPCLSHAVHPPWSDVD